ncbi:MAG: AI-2E family transporter [Saprospiraceae bacterium]|nr:AI-2E family transporter [Saprospiraceae bacterium]
MKNFSRYIAIGLGLVLLGLLLYMFRAIVGYILIAWVLSMVGQPFMRFFRKYVRIRKWQAGPSISAALTIICLFVIVIFVVALFVPMLIDQANNLSGVSYAAIGEAIEEPYRQVIKWMEKRGFTPTYGSAEDMLSDQLKGWFQPAAIGDYFSSFLSMAGNLMMGIFSVVFITFFFLKEDGLFTLFIVSLVPNRFEIQVSNAIEDISHLLTRYFAGILLQVTVITLFVSVLLTILGVPNAVLIGLFAALINVIPYIGPLIGAAFGVFLTISANVDLEFYTQLLPLIIKVVVVFGAMQLLDNFVLQPYIFSNSVLAHPLEIFIVILMGAQINGINGMVLAIPVYTVLRVVAREFLIQFKIVQRITGRMEEALED